MRSVINWMGILVAALALSSSMVMAEEKIYRWVDADGVVHFGEQPNGQFNSEEVKVSKEPAHTPAATQPASADTGAGTMDGEAKPEDAEPSYAQQRRDQRAKQRKEAAKKKQELAASCDLHKNLVAQLEPMTRVIVEREDGSNERMDDQERLRQLKKSKVFIAEN